MLQDINADMDSGRCMRRVKSTNKQEMSSGYDVFLVLEFCSKDCRSTRHKTF